VAPFGRKLGRPLIERRPHRTSRIEKVQGWLKRYEAMLIMGIRFMAGFDTVGTVAIAMSDVSLQRFTALNALGALLWATTLAAASYLLGNVLELVLGDLSRIEKPLLVGLVVLALVWIVWRQVRDHASRAAAPAGPGPSG
jgi:membrane protein DedA with SNARE-associated domain